MRILSSRMKVWCEGILTEFKTQHSWWSTLSFFWNEDVGVVISFCLLATFFFNYLNIVHCGFNGFEGRVLVWSAAKKHLPVSCFGHQSVAAISTAVFICKSNNSRTAKHNFPPRWVLVEQNILWKAKHFKKKFFFNILAIKTHGAAMYFPYKPFSGSAPHPPPVNMGNH